MNILVTKCRNGCLYDFIMDLLCNMCIKIKSLIVIIITYLVTYMLKLIKYP